MFTKPISLLLLVSIFLGTASTTHALEPVWKFTEARVTPVSGIPGRVQVLQLNKSRNQAIDGVTISEKRNRPCQLNVGIKNLDDNSTQTEKWKSYNDTEVDKCNGNAKDSISAGFSDSDYDRYDNRYFVRGLATCSSKVTKNGRRVKGIRVVAAEVWQSKREIDELATTRYDTQANCKGEWHETVYCDSGQVAVGVNVHWSSLDEITGLSLRCGYVSWVDSGS